MRWFWSIAIILLLIPSIALADRPDYSFSDDVFSELEPFPDDFWEIEGLVSAQLIMASQLNNSYFQPEILPTWNYWAERVYSSDSNIFGSYGVFIYPSLFKICNVQKGDIIDVSALIYTNWGIQHYQGAEVYFTYPDHIEVELIEPNNPNILLSPTYPQFLPGWMKVITLRIHINEKINSTINIGERTPSDEYDNEWWEAYQPYYTSGNSLISNKITKCSIKIVVSEKDLQSVQSTGEVHNGFSPLIGIFIIIIILSIITWIRYDRRKKRI